MVKKTVKKSVNLHEIKTQLSDARKELLNLRFKKISGQLENTSGFKKTKKNIARLLTLDKNLREKSDA